jgi:catabolite regulation protein CreA
MPADNGFLANPASTENASSTLRQQGSDYPSQNTKQKSQQKTFKPRSSLAFGNLNAYPGHPWPG